MKKEESITFYAIKNKEGKWFRRKGYGGYGNTWVDKFSQARIYNKIGPARGVASFFVNNYPEFGIPKLVELSVGSTKEIDIEDWVKKQKLKKEKREARLNEREKLQNLELAKKQLEEAKAQVKKFS